jgi:hypothetical protein
VSGGGVTALTVNSQGEVYADGHASVPFPATPTAPQACLASIFLIHLDSQGGFLEATYLGGDSESPNQGGLSIGAGGSLVLTGALQFGGVLAWGVAQVVFGGPGWQAPACLSPSPENAASFFNSVAPGQVFTFMGFGIGPDIGAIYQPGPQGQAPLSLDDPLQQPTASSPERLDQVMWITPVESSMFPRSFGMTSLYVLFPVVSR